MTNRPTKIKPAGDDVPAEVDPLDEIAAADDSYSERYEVREWRKTFVLRAMSDAEAAIMMQFFADHAGDTRAIGRKLIQVCVWDHTGTRRVFDSDRGDKVLRDKRASVVTRISDRLLEINGMMPDSPEEAKND